jgi:hypothetical protein
MSAEMIPLCVYLGLWAVAICLVVFYVVFGLRAR